MNKSELINAIAAETGITKTKAKLAIESLLRNVGGTLKQGNKVSLSGFGSWSIIKRAARDGRNPQTGQIIKIESKNVVKFKAGNSLDPHAGPGTIGGGARTNMSNKRKK